MTVHTCTLPPDLVMIFSGPAHHGSFTMLEMAFLEPQFCCLSGSPLTTHIHAHTHTHTHTHPRHTHTHARTYTHTHTGTKKSFFTAIIEEELGKRQGRQLRPDERFYF